MASRLQLGNGQRECEMRHSRKKLFRGLARGPHTQSVKQLSFVHGFLMSAVFVDAPGKMRKEYDLKETRYSYAFLELSVSLAIFLVRFCFVVLSFSMLMPSV